MRSLLIQFAICALASAITSQHISYQPAESGPNKATPQYTHRAVYKGQYSGECATDGFYYNDASSFVICSNGNAFIQPCALGSQNSAHNYQHGTAYNFNEFCDFNLLDAGYAHQRDDAAYGSQLTPSEVKPANKYGGYTEEAYGGEYQERGRRPYETQEDRHAAH
ncbi:hypothetical protein CAPTEDRAFT_195706 [Capitella teleta]|uniref:Chitin-binding type-2 domain-containing protein n=1 Tax=Capitella teleta TaxID=283909 RepID=X1ZVE7_CAPTE|nr:hypothetical protein CAPTEDRAFT_195706 [Capitella teleta]|eukprot:ELT88418.1 hypothetical protein CAPTEDRAFT_195706 [Capitella teleta]